MFDLIKRVVRNAWAGLWRDPPALRRALLLPVSVLMVARWAPLPRYSSLKFWLFLFAVFAGRSGLSQMARCGRWHVCHL